MSQDTNYLHLYFTGLCAFVPNTAGNQMRVVMVDATSEHHGTPHHPVLVVRYDRVKLDAGCRSPSSLFRDRNGRGDEMARFDLLDQELWIYRARPRFLSFELGLPEHCPDSAGAPERDCFAWVGAMRRVNGQAGRLIARGLDPTRAPHAVGARFRLTDGTLVNHQFAADDTNRLVRWIFSNDDRTSQAGFSQAVAEEVRLDYEFQKDYLEIRAVADIHRERLHELDPICLTPNPKRELNVWVANMPDADIKGRDYKDFAEIGPLIFRAEAEAADAREGHRDPDYHFVHFYDLVNGGPRDRIPRPFDRCEGTGPSAGGPKCPPVRLEAEEDA